MTRDDAASVEVARALVRAASPLVATPVETPPLLTLTLSASYPQKPQVLHNAHLDLAAGEILGLAGSSGAGKSTLILSILGLLGLKGGAATGEVFFRGENLLKKPPRDLRVFRGKHIALVPQSPTSALNPYLRLSTHLEESWRAHEPGTLDWKPLLESVSLPSDDKFLRLYPKNLSVGMAQRFLIALAILHGPQLLLADEPTSALDVITQSEILNLFRNLNQQRNIAILYISHDLPSMFNLCHRIAYLHEAQIQDSPPPAWAHLCPSV